MNEINSIAPIFYKLIFEQDAYILSRKVRDS